MSKGKEIGPRGIPMDGHALYDWEVNTLMGRLLTIVESFGLRDTQEKAAKDLVRQEVEKLFGCQMVAGEHLNAAIAKTTEGKYGHVSSAY